MNSNETAQPSHVAVTRLTTATMDKLKATFEHRKHYPSARQWDALEDIAATLSKMAVGLCPPKAHLSSLDTGVGKTSVIVAFLKVLLRSPAYRDVGVLICLGRLDQIGKMVEDAGLDEGEFACLTGDDAKDNHGKKFNDYGLGKLQSHRARVLFTTHQQIELRASMAATFGGVEVFHYRGKPRAVRVWDEAFMPAMPVTIYRTAITRLFDPLMRVHPALKRSLEGLHKELGQQVNGERFALPDFDELYGDVAPITAILKDTRESTKTIETAELLWLLSGRVVKVRREIDTEAGGQDTIALDYRDHLPADLYPLLILDASGRVRTLYKLWEDRRGGLLRLKDGKKSYKAHTVYLMKVGGSKTAWRDRGKSKQFSEEIAKAILSRPGEPFLVVHHKRAASVNWFDLEEALRGLLPRPDFDRVQFTHWGRHDSSNEWRDIPNVIIAGLLHLPKSMIEASGRAASALPAASGDFSAVDMQEVNQGELKHKAIQAIGRGAIRGCVDGHCPESRTWIMALPRDGLTPKGIRELLPEATVKPWEPEKAEGDKPLKKLRAEEAMEIITKHERIALSDVMEAMGYQPSKDGRDSFNEAVRKREDFQEALEAAGYEEVRSGQGGKVWFSKKATPISLSSLPKSKSRVPVKRGPGRNWGRGSMVPVGFDA